MSSQLTKTFQESKLDRNRGQYLEETEEALQRRQGTYDNLRRARITYTDTLSTLDRSTINCSAVVTGHGVFPKAIWNGYNIAFRVPKGVNVFYYSTPGSDLLDSLWQGKHQLPENPFASAICRSILEGHTKESLVYSEGMLAPNLDIVTDGFWGTDKDFPRDTFVSGIRFCSNSGTMPFEFFGDDLIHKDLYRGRRQYSLGSIVEYCSKNRKVFFDRCFSQQDINIHVVACMSCADQEDSIRMFANKVVEDQHSGWTPGQPPRVLV